MNPPSFTISTFAARNEMPAQEDCIFVSCWAFLCVLVAGSWRNLCFSRMGSVRLFCPDAPTQAETQSNLRSPMLLFDGPYSQRLSSAGCSFVRQASAYPQTKLEPPTSKPFNGASRHSINTLRSQMFIQPFASSRWIREAFFSTGLHP